MTHTDQLRNDAKAATAAVLAEIGKLLAKINNP